MKKVLEHDDQGKIKQFNIPYIYKTRNTAIKVVEMLSQQGYQKAFFHSHCCVHTYSTLTYCM